MKKAFILITLGMLILFNFSCKQAATEEPCLLYAPAFYASNHPAGYADTVSVNASILFHNITSGGNVGTTWLWDFGDGATSTAYEPYHTYTSIGTYIVKLTNTTACGTASASNNCVVKGPTGCIKEIVLVGASINTATTWDSCHIYYVETTFPGLFATLTIEAGTIVKFGAQHGMLVNTGGRLVVNGTAAAPVIFTSSKDDSYGGDTNDDGSASAPAKGDWQFITFGLSSDNSLNYCKIMYAGYASETYEQALNMGDGENNSIRNSVFAHNAGGTDSKFAALNMSWCPISCVAQGNTFFDNGHPVIIGISTNFDDSNIFHNPANPAETNLCNGIFVDVVHSTQAQTMTWSETEVAFVLGGWTGNGWTFYANKILILGDNVVIKFAHYTVPGFGILLVSGDMQIQNHNGTGVVFTSYEDDDYKGDTNGDGASSGTSGSWEGISYPGINWYSWPNIYFAVHNGSSGETVSDIDGNVYHTVTIGTQVWMVENLKTTKYNDGTAIPLVTDGTAWSNLTTPGYCWYNNDAATYKTTYGALYNWYAVHTEKLCPTGWHVPTDGELTTLTDFLGGELIAGGKMKETGTTHWLSPNTGATNESGFTAVPTGVRYGGGGFDGIGSWCQMWSSFEYSTIYAWYRSLVYNGSNVVRNYGYKTAGYPVRCLRD